MGSERREFFEVVKRGLRWRVVHVVDFGAFHGVMTRPFRTVERAFWRHSAAMAYAESRPSTRHITVMNGELDR